MLKPSLQLRIGQQLTMTPQLQQAIRLLQLPSLDLQAHVRETLETNVMLEAEEETSEPLGEPRGSEVSSSASSMTLVSSVSRTKPGGSRPAGPRTPPGRATMTAAAISAISTAKPCRSS
jgi:RNA polymerase sigma-54 factor